jgi:hypothetical protein
VNEACAEGLVRLETPRAPQQAPRDQGVSLGGIVAIKLSNTAGGIEIDNIQYGGFPARSVPALPPLGTVPLALLLLLAAGLVGIPSAVRCRA